MIWRVSLILKSGFSFKSLQRLAVEGLRVARSVRILIHGENIIDVEVPSYMVLFYREILNPFYIFQAFAIILWIFEQYYQYSVLLFFMTIVAAALSLYETHRNLVRLQAMVHMTGHVDRVITSSNGEETIQVCP